MHGATGVTDADMQQAVRAGVRKINFFSGLLRDAMDTVRANGSNPSNDFLKLKQELLRCWKHTLTTQMQLDALQTPTQPSVVNG